jgi:hypothetical protein
MMVIRARIPAGGRRPRVGVLWVNLWVMWTWPERGRDLHRDRLVSGMNLKLSTRRLLTDSRGELAYLLKTGGPFPHLLIDLVSRVDNR